MMLQRENTAWTNRRETNDVTEDNTNRATVLQNERRKGRRAHQGPQREFGSSREEAAFKMMSSQMLTLIKVQVEEGSCHPCLFQADFGESKDLKALNVY